MEQQKLIRITCQGAASLAPTELTEFQGNLKNLSKERYEKLKNLILKEGFCEPISVWKQKAKGKIVNNILNGHQRLRTVMTMMEQEGYTIDGGELPVSLVEAASLKEAKRKVLALTSQFGEMTGEGLYEFVSDNDFDLDELDDFQFPDLEIGKFKDEFFDEPPEFEQDSEDDDSAPKMKGVILECPRCGEKFEKQ